MLPGFRFVIAGMLITIVLPLVAFGIAGSFRSANGTSFNPLMAPSTGPALAEYYYSQFYAPAAQNPAYAALRPEVSLEPAMAARALPAEAALAPAPDAAEIPKMPATLEAPKTAEAVEAPQALASRTPAPIALETSKIGEMPATPGVPKADAQVARLPDAAIETKPDPQPVAPLALPDHALPAPAVAATVEIEKPPPSVAQDPAPKVAALSRAESHQPEPGEEVEQHQAGPVTGPVRLPAKRPAVKRTPRPKAIVQRSRPRPQPQPPIEQPFIPLKNSLFEKLFGGIMN